jgi:hypothetical protein
MLARLFLGALGLIAVAGCGVQPHHTISSSSAAAEISAQLSSRYGVTNPPVTCPPNIRAKKGQQFTCTAILDGQPLTIRGTVTASGGSFTINPAEAIVEMATVEHELTARITQETGQTPVVSCGRRTLLVLPVGGTFTCVATFTGQPPRAVTVTVVDLNGGFRFSLAPAGAP